MREIERLVPRARHEYIKCLTCEGSGRSRQDSSRPCPNPTCVAGVRVYRLVTESVPDTPQEEASMVSGEFESTKEIRRAMRESSRPNGGPGAAEALRRVLEVLGQRHENPWAALSLIDGIVREGLR